MRLIFLGFALTALVPSIPAVAQMAVLGQDTNPKNRCEKSGEGAMWTLHDTRVPGTWGTPPPAGLITVNLTRLETLVPPQHVVRLLTAGETADLGCQGKQSSVSYLYVDQK
jgi:hypothetical protein